MNKKKKDKCETNMGNAFTKKGSHRVMLKDYIS